jgi:hypothetical protein
LQHGLAIGRGVPFDGVPLQDGGFVEPPPRGRRAAPALALAKPDRPIQGTDIDPAGRDRLAGKIKPEERGSFVGHRATVATDGLGIATPTLIERGQTRKFHEAVPEVRATDRQPRTIPTE